MKVYRNEKAGTEIIRTYDALLQLWQVEKEELDISTSYGTTHVIVSGARENPPLVLFHGVGDDSALMWLYNAKALSEHFCLYAVDTIGGPGKSRPNTGYNKLFDDLKWIDEVLLHLKLDTVFLAGVSHGAYLAQYYAVHRNERVKKLVCMAGAVPVGNTGPMKTMMKIFLPEALFPTKRNTEKLIRKLCGEHYGVFTENSLVMTHYRALLKGFHNMAMAYHKVSSFRQEEIDSIRGKTYYLVGEEDPFMKLGGKKAICQQQMHAKFYPGVGHGINHEIAKEINREMIAYFLG